MIKYISMIIKSFFLVVRYPRRLRLHSPIYLKKDARVRVCIGSIIIKGRVTALEHTLIEVVNGGRIEIGSDVYLNRNCLVTSHKYIKIGDGCSFGPNVVIYDHDHCFDHNGKKEGFNTDEVIIGDNCWVGAGVTILRGTHIGDNCVIGAGTVVKGDIPAHSLVTQGRELVIKKLEDRGY